ncbi:MAG TPA: peptidase M61, partial [Bacteroidia bacterium]|nr:peptidase M61 [Bacteroidia bacterium]
YAAQAFRDVMGHEFFHIVTPLSIHSKEIGNFDYDTPKMSEHLWLYEGLTEYAAQHVQVKYGIVSFTAFLQTMHYKMVNADQFTKNLSFTEMSKGCVDKYVNDYNNVYEKGALIGMCLDIKLRQLSGGKYGTQDLMKDLSKKYGKDRSFDDDSLFGDIVKLTYPEIGDFFKDYVIGGKQLPYKEIMNVVGIDYFDTTMVPRLDPLGGYGLGMAIASKDSLLHLVPFHPSNFSKVMGYKKNDRIVSYNGNKIPSDPGAAFGIIYGENIKDGDTITVEVKRKKIFGKEKTVKLSGVIHPDMVVKKHTLVPMKNPTEEQLDLRQAWINQ